MEFTEVECVGDFDLNDRRRHFDSLKDSPQFILQLDSVQFQVFHPVRKYFLFV